MTKAPSFLDHVIATARRKVDAAKARRHSDPNLEKPRSVILASCAKIAEKFEPDDFKFLKSGPEMKRTEGDLTFRIWFQSDRNNIAGRRAAVWIHGAVSSDRLTRWRNDHRMPWDGQGPASGTVTGGQIGNLLDKPSWMEWDFAKPSRRAAETDDAASAIRRIILPFFALFDDPSSAVDIVIHRPVLCQLFLLEYAVAVLGREAAEAAGQSYLRCNPVIRRRFEAAHAKFSQEGLPGFRSDMGSDLAALAVAANLDFFVPAKT